MWKRLLLIQICVCLFLVTGYITIGNSDAELLKKKRGQLVVAMSEHHTVSDIFSSGKMAAAGLIKAQDAFAGYILNGRESRKYADPVDPAVEG